jgi:hypothetical protein
VLGDERPGSLPEPLPKPLIECFLAARREPTPGDELVRAAARVNPDERATRAVIEHDNLALTIDCGGGETRRTRCQTHCAGFCLLDLGIAPGGVRRFAAAGGTRSSHGPDGTLWIVDLGGDVDRVVSSMPLRAEEAVLMSSDEGGVFLTMQSWALGIEEPRPKLEAGERASFYLIAWRRENEVWIGTTLAVTSNRGSQTYRLQRLGLDLGG